MTNENEEKNVEPINDDSAGGALNRTVNSGAIKADTDESEAGGTSDVSGGYANLEQEVKDAAVEQNEYNK